MKKVKITAIRKACYPDLMEKYENPIQHACDIQAHSARLRHPRRTSLDCQWLAEAGGNV